MSHIPKPEQLIPIRVAEKLSFGVTAVAEHFLLVLKVENQFSELQMQILSANNIYYMWVATYSYAVLEIKKTSKPCVMACLTYIYPSMVMSADKNEEREELYRQINLMYANLQLRFDAYAKQKLNFPTKKFPEHTIFDKMFAHQKEGVLLGFTRKYNLLSFQQGLGKTVTSLSISLVMDIKRTIIICPAICKFNWYDELIDVWGINKEQITVLDTKKSIEARGEEKYVIVNYDILKDNILKRLILYKPGHVIIDECHSIKNTASKRYKAVEFLIKNTNCKATFLSGTPVKNRVNDLYAYFKITNHTLGRNYAEFLRRFTINEQGRGGNKVTAGKQLSELYALMSNFLIRKTKDKCLDLPDKIYNTYYFELDEYKEQYENEMAEFLAKARMMNKKTAELAINRLLIITTKAKIKSIIDLAEEIISNGEKVVLFCSFTEPIKMLESYFGSRCVVVNGEVPPIKRNEYEKKFKEDDKCVVFIGQYAAAGVGINLTNASNMIMCNFPWTWAELEQAEDRQHRIGQSKGVNIFYTVCKKSVDERVYGLVKSKMKDAVKVIDNKEANLETRTVTTDTIFDVIEDMLAEHDITIQIEKEFS